MIVDPVAVLADIDRDPGRPLSRSLERRVVELCARQAPYRIEALVVREAPSTLEEILQATRGEASTHGTGSLRDVDTGALVGQRFPVWAGASKRTIWSRPEVNYLFRAWHDSVHVLTVAETDPEGELVTAQHQARLVDAGADRELLWIEVWGQTRYHAKWGRFPENQRQFVLDAWRFGLDRTVSAGLHHRIDV